MSDKKTQKTQEQLDELVNLAYKRGFIDGLRAYAWWKDGKQEVGSCGTTLSDAIEMVEKTWNYHPE